MNSHLIRCGLAFRRLAWTEEAFRRPLFDLPVRFARLSTSHEKWIGWSAFRVSEQKYRLATV
jgi:hypothetical protein